MSSICKICGKAAASFRIMCIYKSRTHSHRPVCERQVRLMNQYIDADFHNESNKKRIAFVTDKHSFPNTSVLGLGPSFLSEPVRSFVDHALNNNCSNRKTQHLFQLFIKLEAAFTINESLIKTFLSPYILSVYMKNLKMGKYEKIT